MKKPPDPFPPQLLLAAHRLPRTSSSPLLTPFPDFMSTVFNFFAHFHYYLATCIDLPLLRSSGSIIGLVD